MVAGVGADALFADPARLHPVAGFGRLATGLERALYADSRARGVVFTATLVGGAAAATWSADRLLRRRPIARQVAGAVVIWSCLGGATLRRVAAREADHLEASDLAAARELLPWLCGRDPERLDSAGLTRAVVESVAENTSDAVVGTLFWAALCGPAGAVAHRAANTLDAMVGHRSPRYENFGMASARLDDLAGHLPARLAGMLTVALAPVVSGSPREAAAAWRDDARRHPSPNAGVVEATCAGALGVQLGGPTPYAYGTQTRPLLGSGRAPEPRDIRRAVTLTRAVQVGTLAVAAGYSSLKRSRDRSARRRSASRWRP